MNTFSRLSLSVVLGAAMGTMALAQSHDHSSGSSSNSSSGTHSTSTPSHNSGSSYHNSYSSNRSSSNYGWNGSRNSGNRYSGNSYGSHTTYGGNHSSYGSSHSYTQNRSYSQGSANGTRSYGNLYGSSGRSYGSQPQEGHGFGGSSAGHNQVGSNHYEAAGSAGGQRYATHGHASYAGNHNFSAGYSSHENSAPVRVHSSAGGGFNARGGGIAPVGGFGHWRDGYRQYDHGFRDSNFFFGAYLFTPWEAECVLSPWYYYPCLPPYLPYDHVVFVNDNCNWYGGASYFYNSDADPSSYGNVDLNYSLTELVNVFQNGDENALGDLVDQNSQIGIYNDGKYMYSVNGQDYYSMMLDNVHGVQNVGFSVTGTRLVNDGAIVNARHQFTDPDGGTDVVYQEYRLVTENGHYVVKDFNTSKSPSGARTFF